MNLEEFQLRHSLQFPVEYVRFLQSHLNPTEVWFRMVSDPDYAVPWLLHSLDTLQETCRIAGAGQAPFFHILRLFIAIQREFSTMDGVVDQDNRLIPYSRIEQAICFGESNGDYLYFDVVDGYSVWIFYHDGGDVRRAAPSFSAWWERTTPIEPAPKELPNAGRSPE